MALQSDSTTVYVQQQFTGVLGVLQVNLLLQSFNFSPSGWFWWLSYGFNLN